MLKEWELGKGVKNQNGKKDCGMKSVERGKMRSSEGKRGADKSSKRKAILKKKKKKKRIRMREEMEKSSSKLLVLDWEHSFLSLAGRGSLA